MIAPTEPSADAPEETPTPPSWLDILGAAAVALGFGFWGFKVDAEQGFQASIGPLLIAAWTAGFAALRFTARRRILAGIKASAHAQGVERAHAVAGAMLFTFLGVMSAKNGQWLTAAGLLLAAVVFGIGSIRPKSET